MTHRKCGIFSFIVISALIVAVISYSECPYTIIDKDYEAYYSRFIILLIHNYFRREVSRGLIHGQPKAKHLKYLKWNDSLAEEAQKISDTCVFDHVNVTDTKFDTVGQNIYISCSGERRWGFNWKKAIDFWFNENEKYKYPGNATEETGHYTQVVWNTTEYVGCGGTYFKKQDDDDDEDLLYCKLYVCNYGPAGNIIGVPPYEADEK